MHPDGYNQIIGNKTSGLAGGVTVARDSRGKIMGSSSDLFRVTRDREHGRRQSLVL